MFPPVQETAEPEVEKVTEPEIKTAAEPENTSGEFQSSDIGSKNAPGHLPTEDQKKRVQEQQQKNCEAPEPSYEAAVKNPLSPESTNLNTSSTTTEQHDQNGREPDSKVQRGVGGEAGGRPGGQRGEAGGSPGGQPSNIQGGAGGRSGSEPDRTSNPAGGERATTISTAGSEATPAREPSLASEEASKHSDTTEPLHEGWQDIGATSGILGSGLEDEASPGIQESEGENGKAAREKNAPVLPLLSKNNATYEDVQSHIAEEKERRLAATAAEAATNRLGKDW